MLEGPTEAGRRAYRDLSLRQKLRLAAEILVTYARARWWLRRRGLDGALAMLRARGPTPLSADSDTLLAGVRLGRIVTKTLGVLPADSRCLVRSLVLVSLLARRGIGARLVVGVQSDPKFDAHAWVELEGVPLLPSGDDAYGRLAEL
jgi:hypothetical protein